MTERSPSALGNQTERPPKELSVPPGASWVALGRMPVTAHLSPRRLWTELRPHRILNGTQGCGCATVLLPDD